MLAQMRGTNSMAFVQESRAHFAESLLDEAQKTGQEVKAENKNGYKI